MELKGLNHLAINTAKLEESVYFYSEILGFKLEKIVLDSGKRYAFLVKEGVCTMEIVEFAPTGEEEKRSIEKFDHLAFDVCDVREIERELINKNIPIEVPCEELEKFNTRVVKIKDPNGITIALREDLHIFSCK